MESQVAWRKPRALLIAHRGEHADAEAVAREAVRLADETDDPTSQADARIVLARCPAARRPKADDAADGARRGDRALRARRETCSAPPMRTRGGAHFTRRCPHERARPPRLEPPAGSRARRSRSRAPGPPRSPVTGPSAARPAPELACASSTAASRRATRWWARCRARSSSPPARTGSRGRPRSRGRRLRARHGLRRDRSRDRTRGPDPERARARARQPRQREEPGRRAAPGDRGGVQGRQPEPLDDEEDRSAVLHELGDNAYFQRASSSPPPTTCRWRATRGASRR